MKLSVAENWVEAPLKQFVDEARVQLAVLLNTSGQVLGQYGFTSSVDVMTACALAAATTASSGELGRQVDGKPFTGLHYAGKTRQIFLGQIPMRKSGLILMTVFNDESSLGLVHLFFAELCANLLAAAPAEAAAGTPALALDFERELNRNLAVMFGRA
jgi:hypothetical protein